MEMPELAAFEGRLEDGNMTHERTTPAEVMDAVERVGVDKMVAPATLSLSGTELTESFRGTIDPTPAELWDAVTGITNAAFGVASYGTVYLPHDGEGSEAISLFVDRHIVILQASDLVPDMDAAFDRLSQDLSKKAASGILATGPSATADLGALVHGAHGPGEVHVILVTEA